MNKIINNAFNASWLKNMLNKFDSALCIPLCEYLISIHELNVFLFFLIQRNMAKCSMYMHVTAMLIKIEFILFF